MNKTTAHFIERALQEGGAWHSEVKPGTLGALQLHAGKQTISVLPDKNGNVLVMPILGTAYEEEFEQLVAKSEGAVQPIGTAPYCWRVKR